MDKKEYDNFKHSSFTGMIGIAQEDITPPVGIYSRNWGASDHDVAEGIHRPIMLSCLTFQTQELQKALVLITADLGWWKNSEDEWILRKGILEAFSLPSSHLMFCLSHTHSGPSICSEDASKPGGEFIKPYLDNIQKKAIIAVKNALTNVAPATLTWHYSKCNLATNRDLSEEGSDRFLVGYNPKKPADDTLLVGRVTDKKNQIRATIINYACHPTTLGGSNKLISPDYIGSMREIVESETKSPCLFLQGSSGELAPAEQYLGDPEMADKHGRQLGYAVLSSLESMLPPLTQLVLSEIVESGAPLAIWKETSYEAILALSAEMVEIPLKLKSLPPLAEIEQEWKVCEDRMLKERLWRKRCIRKAVGDGEIAKVSLWVWQLGDSFLIGQPNEAYSEFQQNLRHQLSPNAVGVINIANGWNGYLPPKRLYRKDVYSVWQTPFAAGCLEILTETAVRIVKKSLRK